jgi:hypothetical protein
MNKTKVQDKYNKDKMWLIKMYEGGGIYYNQENKGKKLNRKYQRTTKKWLKDILDI